MADEKKEEKTLEEDWKTVSPPWKIHFAFINREWSF